MNTSKKHAPGGDVFVWYDVVGRNTLYDSALQGATELRIGGAVLRLMVVVDEAVDLFANSNVAGVNGSEVHTDGAPFYVFEL